MTDAQMERCRKRLEQFLVDLLEPVGRSERRHWGSVYVRGLLLSGGRKSIEPMAARLPEGNIQALQQFLGQSPWEWNSVWERLARRMTKELDPEQPGSSTILVSRNRAAIRSALSASIRGHWQSRQLPGRRQPASCRQMGSAVLAWRLYLPESWATNRTRREEAGIPDDIGFKPKWQLALDLIDQVRGWELPDRIVIAEAGYGDTTEFRDALQARQLPSVVGISPT